MTKAELEKLYRAALKADEEYSKVCAPFGGRWVKATITKQDTARVQAAYHHKIEADRRWLDALHTKHQESIKE